MPRCITVLPQKQNIEANEGENLLAVLRRAGFLQDAPCGGNGTCGKCKVTVDGTEVLACQTPVDRDMAVTLPPRQQTVILTEGISGQLPTDSGVNLAIDIGTTTVAAYLLENGQVLATESRRNPQASFGADVVTRLRHAIKGQTDELTATIRECITNITQILLDKTSRTHLDTVCVVGNPAMQQLFLGIPVDNLVKPSFAPRLTKTGTVDGGRIIPLWAEARLFLVPNISGYISADTVAAF